MDNSRLPKPETEGVCYSEDETMKRRLLRKRQLEDSEVYNAPETMAVKRRAVKEAAKTMPVPKKITNLSFDDQIEPSEAPEAPEAPGLEQKENEASLHAGEKGSNAAERGAGAVRDVVVVEVAASRRVASTAKGTGGDGQVTEPVDVVKVEQAPKQRGKIRAKAVKHKAKDLPKAQAKVQHKLPIVLLEPTKWAQKSAQGARRSRRRLRRLLREEQALVSSQLQVA